MIDDEEHERIINEIHEVYEKNMKNIKTMTAEEEKISEMQQNKIWEEYVD